MAQARSLARSRRQYPRVELNFELMIQADGVDYWVNAVNLSFGGALIETDAPLEGGQLVTLTITHLELYGTTQARVVWTGQNGYGLKFVNPRSDFTNALVALITPLLSSEAEWEEDA